MMEYLSDIQVICDSIAASKVPLSVEDIILYTLNGLSSTHQAFKTTMQINLQPIGLDDFYALLCSEELNLDTENLKENNSKLQTEQQLALTILGRGRARLKARYSNRGSGVNPSTTNNRVPKKYQNKKIKIK